MKTLRKVGMAFLAVLLCGSMAACSEDDGDGDGDGGYGYGGCGTLEALNQEVRRLYMEEILPCIPKGLCAAIYTQVSDVEDEINGLMTYDRKVQKLENGVLLAINNQLRD